MSTSGIFKAKSLTCYVVPGPLEYEKGSREATAHFRAAVFEGMSLADLTPPQRGEGFEVTVKLRKEDDGVWRVHWHERQRFPANDIWRLAVGSK